MRFQFMTHSVTVNFYVLDQLVMIDITTSFPEVFWVFTWCGCGTTGPPNELILSSNLL